MQVKERIAKLREAMGKSGLDGYLVPTADFHESEYVGAHFKARAWLSGFQGSAGTLLVEKESARLWTDGRYFIAAAQQLEGSGIELMRMGEEGVPTLEEYLEKSLPQGGALGFDGRVVNANLGEKLMRILRKKEGRLETQGDLVDEVWKDRPPLSARAAYFLEEKYAGESRVSKLARLREQMAAKGATAHVLTSLDDIAWLMNLRGDDVEYNPVVLSYALITPASAILYANRVVFSEYMVRDLERDGVTLRPYDRIYQDLKALGSEDKVLLDKGRVNYAICRTLEKVGALIDEMNPTTQMKAVKNPVELDNLRRSHLKDGVAFTHFMYWLKTQVGKMPITELSASDYLEARRREQEDFVELSFGTIAGYGEHGALMHYAATPESDAALRPEGMLLVDSGAQYMDGTTDITRTMALGPLSDEQKLHFTTVLRSMLNLMSAKFLYGCTGLSLDILARGPIWDLDLDYKCGTGHGVGFLLNVHEGPQGFRWRARPDRSEGAILEEGMVTTNEPGIYLEGRYGIRTENEMICRKGEKNEYGQFMYFEPLTYAPIDLDAVEPALLSEREKRVLNDYHAMVFDKLSPFMQGEELEWLRHYTRAI
ncbi:MAG TPA: aminopeptidase P family protein [Candidatus Faecaligallichristensenella faecipullorum]|nr:aminopeptidase P family protein [Candidatus Faecaligallichristensenella faecipullorum]